MAKMRYGWLPAFALTLTLLHSPVDAKLHSAQTHSFTAVNHAKFSDTSTFSGKENQMFAKRILARKQADDEENQSQTTQETGARKPEVNKMKAKRATEKRITAIEEESENIQDEENDQNLEQLISSKKEQSKKQHRDLIKAVEDNLKKQEQKREEKREQKKEEQRIEAKIKKEEDRIVAEDKKVEVSLNEDAEVELKRALAEVMQIGESEVQTEDSLKEKNEDMIEEEENQGDSFDSAIAGDSFDGGSFASVKGEIEDAESQGTTKDAGNKAKTRKNKKSAENNVDDSDKSVDNESEIQEEIMDIAEDIIDNGLVNLHRQNSIKEDEKKGKKVGDEGSSNDLNDFDSPKTTMSMQSGASSNSGGLRRYEGRVIKEKIKKKLKDDVEDLIEDGIEEGKKEKKEEEQTNTKPPPPEKSKYRGLKHLEGMQFTTEDSLFGSLAVDMSALRNGFKVSGKRRKSKDRKKKLEEGRAKARRGGSDDFVGWKGGKTSYRGGSEKKINGGIRKGGAASIGKKVGSHSGGSRLSPPIVRAKKQNVGSHGRVVGGMDLFAKSTAKPKKAAAKLDDDDASDFVSASSFLSDSGEEVHVDNYDNVDDKSHKTLDAKSDATGNSKFSNPNSGGNNGNSFRSNASMMNASMNGSAGYELGSSFGDYSGMDTAEIDKNEFGIDDPDDMFAEFKDLKLNDPTFKRSKSFFHNSDKPEGKNGMGDFKAESLRGGSLKQYGKFDSRDSIKGSSSSSKVSSKIGSSGSGKSSNGRNGIGLSNTAEKTKRSDSIKDLKPTKRAQSASDRRVNGKRVKSESDLRMKANRIGDGVLQESAELVKRLNARKHDSDRLVREEAVDYRLKTPEDLQKYLTGSDVDPEHKLLVQKFQLTYATNCWELLNDPSLFGQLSKKIVFEMRGREEVFPSVKNPEVRKNLEVTLKRNAKVVQEYNHEVDGVLEENPWYKGDTGKKDAEVAGMKSDVGEAAIQSDSKKKGAIVALISVITSVASTVKKVVQKGWEMFKKVMSLAVQALTWVVEGLICAASVLYRLKGFIVLLGTAWCYEAFDSFLPESMRRVAASFLTIAVPIAFNMTLPFIFGSVMSSIGASGVVSYVGSYATSAAGTIFGPLLGPLAKTGAVVQIIDLLAGGSTSMVGWACTFLQTNDGLRNALVTSAFNDANAEVKASLDCMHGMFRARRLDRTYDRERLEKLEREAKEEVEDLRKKLDMSEEDLKELEGELRGKDGKKEVRLERMVEVLEEKLHQKREKQKQAERDEKNAHKAQMDAVQEQLKQQTEMNKMMMENMQKMQQQMMMQQQSQMQNMHRSQQKVMTHPQKNPNDNEFGAANPYKGYSDAADFAEEDEEERELQEELERDQRELSALDGNGALDPEEVREEKALWGGGNAKNKGKNDKYDNDKSDAPHNLNPFGDTQNLNTEDDNDITSATSVGLYHRKNEETGRFERGGRYHRRKQREMMSAVTRLKKMDQTSANSALAQQQAVLKQLEERIRLKNKIMEAEDRLRAKKRAARSSRRG